MNTSWRPSIKTRLGPRHVSCKLSAMDRFSFFFFLFAVARGYQSGYLGDGPPTGPRIPTGLVWNTTQINVLLLVITAYFGSLFLRALIGRWSPMGWGTVRGGGDGESGVLNLERGAGRVARLRFMSLGRMRFCPAGESSSARQTK